MVASSRKATILHVAAFLISLISRWLLIVINGKKLLPRTNLLFSCRLELGEGHENEASQLRAILPDIVMVAGEILDWQDSNLVS